MRFRMGIIGSSLASGGACPRRADRRDQPGGSRRNNSLRRRLTRHLAGHLANDLALQIAGVAPKYVNFEDVPADVVEKARKAILEDPSMERVPQERREEVLNNKLKKELSGQVLMMQPWVKDETVIIGDLVKKVIAETGENIVLRRFSRFALGE